ncbi:MAG: hypothetical protein M1831_006321 [Alyxoria varia]|nr:MAG: hypothetical protein M1831_006321 [Alyxoria varia]
MNCTQFTSGLDQSYFGVLEIPHQMLRHPRFQTSIRQAFSHMSTLRGKYCRVCGRLISPNHRNFEERKHCGKQCAATRLSAADRSLEELFMSLSKAKGSVDCGEVQERFTEEQHNNGSNEDHHSATEASKHEAGMDHARWRERVRRAGRRVIAFEYNDEGSFQCVQKGKPVEPSYAKGEWAVRFIRS